MFLVILVAFCFSAITAAPSSSGRADGVYPHDTTSLSELTDLYNTPVIRAQRVWRPKGSRRNVGVWDLSTHSGVRVTTDDNHQWLIHKGHGYGRSSQTVVVDAAHMSAQWREMPERPVERRTLGDFVRAGGENYGLFRNNCHHAATSMMNMID